MTIATYSNRTGSRSFSVSDADRVVLARVLYGESGGLSAEYGSILWTLARRWLWSRYPGTFIQLVYAFCQPINPRWQRGGDLFEAARKRGHWSGGDKAADRRAALAAMKWEQFPERIRAAVLAFQNGMLRENRTTKNKRATNWGSWPGIHDRFPHGASITNGRNWFFQDLQDRGLSVLQSLVSTVSGGGGAAIAVVVVAAIMWAALK